MEKSKIDFRVLIREQIILKYTMTEIMEQIHDLLQKGFLEVKFEKKKDLTTRTMFCTRLKDYVPIPKGKQRKENDLVITAFDVELDEWRSFNVETIKGVWKIQSPELEHEHKNRQEKAFISLIYDALQTYK